MGGALYEVDRFPRELLRKRDRHRTSTKFRLESNKWTLQTALTRAFVCVCVCVCVCVVNFTFSSSFY
jgi:hypothetical protein